MEKYHIKRGHIIAVYMPESPSLSISPALINQAMQFQAPCLNPSAQPTGTVELGQKQATNLLAPGSFTLVGTGGA